MSTSPWSAAPQPGPPSDPDDNGSAAVVASAILIGVLLVVVAALILGLSFDFGFDSDDGNPDAWKFKAKVVGLSGFGAGFGSFASGGALLVGIALIGALALARAARGTGRDSMVSSTILGAGVVAGYLALVTVLCIVVDFTFFSDAEGETAAVISALIADVGSLVVLGAATWWSVALQRP